MKRVRATTAWQELRSRAKRPGEQAAPAPRRFPKDPLHFADVRNDAEQYDEAVALCGAAVEVVDEDVERGVAWCAQCRDESDRFPRTTR